jgi:predicted O-methyltransferase YrrM
VLLAAGPSLDRALPVLARHQHEAVLIATDTALRPCLAAGVAPHFCVAVDPSAANGRHLSDLAVPERTWLCAEGSLLPEAMAAFGDRLIVFRVGDHAPWSWMSTIGLERGVLRAWGSVLTTAFDLATTIGGSPIVFAGADLAYTDARPYCSGTTYERDWAALRNDGVPQDVVARSFIRQPVDMRDVHGRQTVSAPHLISFRDWLVEQSATLEPGRVLNASGAGILHGPSIGQTTLSDVLGGGTATVPEVRDVVGATVTASSLHLVQEAVGDVLWGLRAGTGVADTLVSGWTDFTSGQVSPAAIQDTLMQVARDHRLARQPIVARRDDAPLAQEEEELLEAFGWMREIGPIGIYVEIGSRFGGSLYAMARYLGRDAMLVAIDLPDGPWGHPEGPAVLARVAADLRDEGYDVHVIAGDSHAAGTRSALERLLAGRAIDVLFLDGDRTTAGILRDAADYGAFLRDEGLLLLHDVAAEPGPRGRPRAELTERSRDVLDSGHAAWTVLSGRRRVRRSVHAYGLGGIHW